MLNQLSRTEPGPLRPKGWRIGLSACSHPRLARPAPRRAEIVPRLLEHHLKGKRSDIGLSIVTPGALMNGDLLFRQRHCSVMYCASERCRDSTRGLLHKGWLIADMLWSSYRHYRSVAPREIMSTDLHADGVDPNH